MKRIIAFLRAAFACPITMANEAATSGPGSGVPKVGDSIDFKKMVYSLLGVPDDSAPEVALDMLNCRYKEAMEADAEDEDKMKAEKEKKAANEITAANEAKTAAETKLTEQTTLAANEKTRADQLAADLATAKQTIGTVEQQFANERTAHVKTILDTAITANRITAAERPALEADFAKDFTAANEALSKRTPALPQGQLGPGALKQRNQATQADATKRRDAVIEACNEIMRTEKVSYDVAFAKVRKNRGELFTGMAEPETPEYLKRKA